MYILIDRIGIMISFKNREVDAMANGGGAPWWLALIFIVGGGLATIYFAANSNLIGAAIGVLFFIVGWFIYPRNK